MFQPTLKFIIMIALWIMMYFYITLIETLPSGRKA
jgi:hypothetical protein